MRSSDISFMAAQKALRSKLVYDAATQIFKIETIA
jgi:hypothetical protein